MLHVVHPDAATADIGSRETWVSLPPDREEETVRCFGTFTSDLENRVDTVAMESTGVYWIPPFELLEAKHIQAYLVNARYIQNVPGRKTNVLDCQSPRESLPTTTKGLWEICALRSLWTLILPKGHSVL
jgi:transposase